MAGDGSAATVTAVLVHWGDPDPTLKATKNWVATGLFSNIVVIANDLRLRPASLCPDVYWEVPARNLGYGGACNYAALRYPADVYAVFNADMSIGSSAISLCLAALNRDGVGIVGPVLYGPDGKVNSSCGYLLNWRIARTSHAIPAGEFADCDWITGAAMFCRNDVLAKQQFDGSYFLGYEDADLCVRAKAAGWRVGVVTGSRAIHARGLTMANGKWPYYVARNAIWFSRRHRGIEAALWSSIVTIALLPRVALVDVIKRRRFGHLRSYWYGLVDGWRSLPSTFDAYSDEPRAARFVDWR